MPTRESERPVHREFKSIGPCPRKAVAIVLGTATGTYTAIKPWPTQSISLFSSRIAQSLWRAKHSGHSKADTTVTVCMQPIEAGVKRTLDAIYAELTAKPEVAAGS